MFHKFVIARCAKRAAVIQLDCFVATLLAMTVYSPSDVGITALSGSGCKRIPALARSRQVRDWNLA
jgi:F0F1-type ATP synthase assembly protein I